MQDVSAEKFEESPIIFGDYLKMGASQSDRIYEELVDMKKVASVLSEVGLSLFCTDAPGICGSKWIESKGRAQG